VAIPEGWHGWDEYADFYDWENARTVGRRDVRFWQVFARNASTRVLELGCGTGRVLRPVARSSRVPVVGIDRSAAMLAHAVVRMRRVPRASRPAMLRGDIRRLPLADERFDRVIAAYGLLQSLLTPRDLDAALAEAARVLAPGGRLGLDLVPDLQAWDEYRRRVRFRGRARGGARITLVETVHQDRRRGITTFDEEFTASRGGRRHRRRFSLTFRTVAVDEMVERLARAGLDAEVVSGDYRGGAWTPTAGTWLIVATKRG
jgi:SAM-dependent methyltransferase